MKNTNCDAAYGEGVKEKNTLRSFQDSFGAKYPGEPKPTKIWIAEKYLGVPVPPSMQKEWGRLVFIGPGVVLLYSAIKDALPIITKEKMGRREFLKLAKPAIKIVLSSTFLAVAFSKFAEIIKPFEKRQKEETGASIPYAEVSSAMTAVILEEEVAPRVGRGLEKKPVICLAVDEDETGVAPSRIEYYLEHRKEARELLNGYKKHLEKTYKVTGGNATLHKLWFYNGTKSEWNLFKIDPLR